MKFSIQEEGHPGEPAPEKQIFFTFKEASAQTGLPSKVILRVLQSEQIKYVRRVDKKVFWIREEEESPFIQIDGEKLISWILRRNLMKSLGNLKNWSNS